MFTADFHIHSKYSRATSPLCVPEMLDIWARRKGIDVLGTGDFTHPLWRAELKEKLKPEGNGLYTLSNNYRISDKETGIDTRPQFIITGEISSIYKKDGKTRKVHNLVILPSLEAADTLSNRLASIGNVVSDGRPILGLDSHNLLEILLETVPEGILIPAHIWTPHFSLFGAYSGFDSIESCFEDLTPHIHALETGLSADPSMIRRISALDRYLLVSNSDAHSPMKLAREANLFDTALSYPHIAAALRRESDGLISTIEFFPQEGKYYYNGHRKCHVCQTPSETLAASGICPVCGRRTTTGVLHRIAELADRKSNIEAFKVKPFESLIPLTEIIAESLNMKSAGKKVMALYFNLLRNLGSELYVLREARIQDIEKYAGAWLAKGISRLRNSEITVQPGYDGEYGRIKVFSSN